MWLAVDRAMGDLPIKNPCPCYQKTLDFYLKLLLLLKSVMHNQSLMQHCPLGTAVGGFTNFTSKAGSPFFFELPLPASLGHTQHYRLSLADGDRTLPHWMVLRRQGRTLAGLALTEECGIYRLKVSVTGEKCTAYFYLHIQNKTVSDKDPARDMLSCPEGKMTIWANLVLQMNPVTLDASQRLHVVSTMADYLHLPVVSVSLFSTRKPFIQKQNKLRVCRQGQLAEKPDVSGDVAELLWPIGCQEEERRSDLATVLEHSTKEGGLARLLEAPVLEWRVLCMSEGVRHKVKRDLQRPKLTPTHNVIVPPPTQVQQTVKHDHSRSYSPPLPLEPSLSSILLHKNSKGTKLERAHAEDSTERPVNFLSNEVLLQLSGKQANASPVSPDKIFKFTYEGHAFKTEIYHSDINPEMSIISVKTDQMQKIQVISSPTVFHPFNRFVNTLLERQVFPCKISLTTLHASVCVEFMYSPPNWFSLHSSHEHIKQTGLSASKVQPLVEAISCSEQVPEAASYMSISQYFCTTQLPEDVSTVRHFVGEPSADNTLSPSSTPHSISPPLPLTPASYSVTSTLTHEAVDRESHATRLTLRPHMKETSLWTEYHRTNHTDSESQLTVSSQGHIIFSQEPTQDHNTAKAPLQNLPSVSHPPPTENYNDVLLLNSRLKPTHSPPSSNKIQTTRLFPDVSPTSYLMTEQLSITLQTETIQHLSPAPSGMNQDVMSQLNVTTQDVSPTTSTGQLTLPGQTELESSLPTSLLEPSVMMFTPALPSELFSGQLETLNITYPVFSIEHLEASSSLISLLQTFSSSSPSDIGAFSLQQNLESRVVMDLESESGTEVSFDPNGQTQTLISGILLTTLLPEQINLSSAKIPPIISVLSTKLKDESFEEQPSAHESLPFMTSMQTLVHTLQLEDSQQIHNSSHEILVPGMTKSMYLNTIVLTTIKPGPSLTSPLLLLISKSRDPVSEDHFDPTAPSTAQEPYTTSSIQLINTVGPSFPLCGQSVAKDHIYVSGCTPLIKSTYLENTVEHILAFSTSYSHDVKSWTAFPSQFLVFSTQTLVDYLSSPPTRLTSGSSFSIITQHTLLAEGLSSDKGQSSVQPSSSSASSSSASVSNFLNLPPKVLQSIPVLMATVGFPFHYTIPPNTFLDPEDGGADALSLEISLIDGPPLSMGTWLALDGLELHGVPLEVDLRFAPQHLLLVARDRQGLSVSLPLTLDLQRSPIQPCHVFTLTAQRSLHSILRHRHRVDLLLRKLSRFFNSSSSHHLSVVSMTPGSTVVSWYNCSLCEKGQIKITHCHVAQIQSMWLAMRSTDGSVNPEFREAMLPEFPITKVGPVSYRQDCFSSTPTPTLGSSTPAIYTTTNPGSDTNTSLSPTSITCVSASTSVTPTSRQINSHQWMVGVLAALLVVCLLILIVLLVAAVLYFCRGRGGSRALAIWPANRLLSVQSRDLRAIRPRRPPLFQPELPPPPLRLWISLTQDDERPLPLYYEQGRKTLDKALKPRPPYYDFSN